MAETRKRTGLLIAALLLLGGVIGGWIALQQSGPAVAPSTREQSALPQAAPAAIADGATLPDEKLVPAPALLPKEAAPRAEQAPDPEPVKESQPAREEPAKEVLTEFSATISGRVVDESGNGIADGEVRVDYSVVDLSKVQRERGVDVGERNLAVRSGPDGFFSYKISDSKPGDELTGILAHYATPPSGARSEQQIVHGIRNGEYRGGLLLEIPSAGTATGRVFDSNGKPLAGVHMIFLKIEGESAGSRLESTVSDEHGNYRLARLLPGRWRIHVGDIDAAEPAKLPHFDVRAGEEARLPDVFDVPRTYLRFRLRDAAGEPLSEQTSMRLSYRGPNARMRGRQVMVGRDGYVLLYDVNPAENEIDIRAEGFKPLTISVTIVENHQNTHPDVWLEPAAD